MHGTPKPSASPSRTSPSPSPCRFFIKVPAAIAGKVRVAPSGGSLPANGWVAVRVTVISTFTLNTYVTVEPGNIAVTVVLIITI